MRVFKPQVWNFKCPCSQARVDPILRGLGRNELEDIIKEHGQINVDCEFCGEAYQYDAVDVEHILSGERDEEDVSKLHH